jgi:hypothetical protein
MVNYQHQMDQRRGVWDFGDYFGISPDWFVG